MDTKNKQPMRQCIGCREMKSKRELLRIIRTPERELLLDLTGKKNGRGAYLCRNPQCFAKAKKNKALEHSFRMNISEEVYESLKREWEKFDEK